MDATDIAQRFGLRRYPRSWRGRCPACHYPGTFSVRTGRNGCTLFYCASCQDRAAIADAVARATGHEQRPEPRDDRDDSKACRQWKQETALRLWRGSEPATGTPADVYLTTRGLPGLAASPALRFCADCSHPEGGRYPAMVALVTDVTGAPLAVHRTYLTRDGRKAGVEPAKASLGPIWGGTIRLEAPADDKPLVIGEGIESSASAGLLTGFPAWAAISAGNLGRGVVLPPDVYRVMIAADPDKVGRHAAREAWTRWRAEDRGVQVAVPSGEGDFNDLLLVQEAAHG